MGDLFWGAILLSKLPSPTFHNLNSLSAKAQYAVSLLTGVSASHLFINKRIQGMKPKIDNQHVLVRASKQQASA